MWVLGTQSSSSAISPAPQLAFLYNPGMLPGAVLLTVNGPSHIYHESRKCFIDTPTEQGLLSPGDSVYVKLKKSYQHFIKAFECLNGVQAQQTSEC